MVKFVLWQRHKSNRLSSWLFHLEYSPGINNLGVLETPYRKVVDGTKVSDEIVHLSADDGDGYTIAFADSWVDVANYPRSNNNSETLTA